VNPARNWTAKGIAEILDGDDHPPVSGTAQVSCAREKVLLRSSPAWQTGVIDSPSDDPVHQNFTDKVDAGIAPHSDNRAAADRSR